MSSTSPVVSLRPVPLHNDQVCEDGCPDEYYLTILDDNQVKERKIKHIRPETEYKYGTSSLVDYRIELMDSLEKDYIHECRAVIVKWGNAKKSVLVTDIPRELETFYYFLDNLENRRVRRGTQRKITTLCDSPRPLRLIFFPMTH